MATQIIDSNNAVADNFVAFQNSQGGELRGTLLKLTRHQAVFEVYAPFAVLRLSEVLSDFRISLSERVVYSGRALVNNVLNTGAVLVCEAQLEDSWIDVNLSVSGNGESRVQSDFQGFMRASQEAFRILPEFKLVVADMQIFLQDLRRWLEQVELGVMSQPSGDRQRYEHNVIHELQEPVLRTVGTLFEKFEQSCQNIPSDLQPAHCNYVKRQLHPLVLCAPFMYRTFRKPLGYAGDYEMVNMMVRDPIEGASVFAKVLNTFFLSTPPVVAHRNRIEYLVKMLAQEAMRARFSGRTAKVFNLGCGPAKEVQDFIADSDLSNHLQFTLLDFNEETLAYTNRMVSDAIRKRNRSTRVQLVKKAVAQVLKEASKPNSTLLSSDYDLVYCAGLFDYMPDYICRQLMSIFYGMLAPGGLLVATNVDKYNPSRNWMEYSVDWHLIYRDANAMAKLAPPAAAPDSFRIFSENSGVNTFIEIRKPNHA